MSRAYAFWAGRSLAVLTLLSALTGCAANSGQSNMAYGDWSPVDAEFEAGANRLPTAKTLYAMARILAAQGKDGEFGFVLERLIREQPRFKRPYCDLAELYLRHRRLDDAIRTLSAGIRTWPKDPVLLNNLGVCWLLKGQYQQALERFTQAAAVMPHDARYRANMAVSLGLMGRYDESLSLYKQVVSAPDAHFNLAVLCEARGDTRRAAEEYERADVSGVIPQDPSAAHTNDSTAASRPTGDTP